MAPDQQDYFEDDIPTMPAVDIADWRLRTFALYDKVRQLAATNPFDAHVFWRQERDLMFATHPASALTADMKASFSGLRTADYDPSFRRYAALSPEGSGQEMNVETGTDGVVPFTRIGTFELPGLGSLAAWRLRSYGGGIFVPFRDATAGKDGGSYGAGRYLLDTVKGSFHGTRGAGAEQEFVLDFNFAYNPSCAYNEAWACPLAGPANRLTAEVPVGELYLG
ncbi:hypothetical protein CQ020_02890 [Arthrobacter sp. MYb23]|uniref:DUF1684 domain-containing protein n=1 Tax=unclassified Arthrobacter TaxID=235627 RepID=UPI000CFACE5E|nr:MULTISPECIES: DUF1684 domain-containing protein [unclassified Arthrobacter]PRB40486.1 hypothetical protein CQ038_17325 [Arthrobacter sp. MYb51]PRB98424.1 hypothetical protein CQ020_02890 [Arthrobacter sp. MYb23]